MATRNLRPPLKHTPFTELLPDGTQFVTNPWYDWALNIARTLDAVIVDQDDDNTDVDDLLTADVAVFARDMLPTATGGCSSLLTVELGASQPNYHVLLFDPVVQESADFHIMLPFSWAGRQFKIYVYWAHASGGTAHDVVWEVTANSTGDNESLVQDFVGGAVIYDTGGTAGNLYIAELSEAVPVVRNLNRDGNLLSMRVIRLPTHAANTLDIDAGLIAVRFVLTDLPLVEPDVEPNTDPYWENVVLLVKGGVDGDLVINDLSVYASSVTIVANAAWASAQQMLGNNTIRLRRYDPNIPVFVGDADRFSRPSGEDMTLELFFRYSVLDTYGHIIFAWIHVGDGDRIMHLEVVPSGGFYIRIGGTTTYIGYLAPNIDYFAQFTIVGNTFYIDVGDLAGDGTTTQWLTGTFPNQNALGTYHVSVATYFSYSSGPDSTTAAWVTPLRWTKGVARSRGFVPTEDFGTSGPTITDPSDVAQWYSSDSNVDLSTSLLAEITCSPSAPEGVAIVSAPDGTNTIAARTGKVYLEFAFQGSDDMSFVGLLANAQISGGYPVASNPFGSTGYYCITNVQSGGQAPGTITDGVAASDLLYDYVSTLIGSVIGIAWDTTTGKVWFRRSGTWMSGNPATGVGPTFTLPSASFSFVAGSYLDGSTSFAVTVLNARFGRTVDSPPLGFTWYA